MCKPLIYLSSLMTVFLLVAMPIFITYNIRDYPDNHILRLLMVSFTCFIGIESTMCIYKTRLKAFGMEENK